MPPAPTSTLALPALDGALAWLRATDDPVVELLRTLAFQPGAPAHRLARLRAAVSTLPLVKTAFASQHHDGSWGEAPDARRRVLSTLWMAKALTELGVDATHPGWQRAAGFLTRHTLTTSTGVFSLDGHDSGVLCCYAGIAGEMYVLAGRLDLARPQIDWILRHQDVRVAGRTRRSRPAEAWHERLRTRYGGCLSDTTCLVGLVKTGRALLAWIEHESDAETADLMAAIRTAYLERRLLYRSNGETVPIGSPSGEPDRWLQPTFPLDWHTDLIEVLDFVARSGPPDARMQPAVDRLTMAQLPDGTWPLRRSLSPPQLPAPERRSRTKGSPLITLRVAAAITACRVDHGRDQALGITAT